MRKFVMALSVIAATLMSAGSAFAGVYDELTPAEQAQIQKGQIVYRLEEVQGSKWPRILSWRRLEATPEEALAVLADYELVPSYYPGVLSCKIAQKFDKRTWKVDYVIDMPWPVSDEKYSISTQLAQYDNGASYQLAWKMVRADSADIIDGFTKFETLGTGTIMAQMTFIRPTSGMAGSFKDKAIAKMKEMLVAYTDQLQLERTKNQPLLQKQIEALRVALAPGVIWIPDFTF